MSFTDDDLRKIAREFGPVTADLATELLAARKALADREWQPIETCPKDGTWVELWRDPQADPHGPYWAPLITGRWFVFDDGEAAWAWPDDTYEVHTGRGRSHATNRLEVGDCYEALDFSHWRPLSGPPVKETPDAE